MVALLTIASKNLLLVAWLSLDQHHSVRSKEGSFAIFFLMSRPPLLS